MINFKNVAKLLPKSEKPISWYQTESANYLFTGYWGLKTHKDLRKEKYISEALLKIFKQIPKLDSGIKLEISGKICPQEFKDFKNLRDMLDIKEGLDHLEFTNLAQIDVSIKGVVKDLCIFKAANRYIPVDRDFMNFVNSNSNFKIRGGSGYSHPVYFTDDVDVLMLLPIRGAISEHLKPINPDE